MRVVPPTLRPENPARDRGRRRNRRDQPQSSALASGDVILYAGNHPLHLRQRQVTGCPWSQVGLLVRLTIRSDVLVFESTMLSPCKDILLGRVSHGVQLTLLEERIGTFDGEMAVRRLRPSLSGDRVQALCRFALENHGLPFNEGRFTAARALCRRTLPGDGSSFFCSELVAAAFQHIDLLPAQPDGRSANNYIPADFSTLFPEADLPLLGGHRLATELPLLDPIDLA